MQNRLSFRRVIRISRSEREVAGGEGGPSTGEGLAETGSYAKKF